VIESRRQALGGGCGESGRRVRPLDEIEHRALQRIEAPGGHQPPGHAVLDDLAAYTGRRPCEDDVTLVVLRRPAAG